MMHGQNKHQVELSGLNTDFFFLFVKCGITIFVPAFNNYSLLPVLCVADFSHGRLSWTGYSL